MFILVGFKVTKVKYCVLFQSKFLRWRAHAIRNIHVQFRVESMLPRRWVSSRCLSVCETRSSKTGRTREIAVFKISYLCPTSFSGLSNTRWKSRFTPTNAHFSHMRTSDAGAHRVRARWCIRGRLSGRSFATRQMLAVAGLFWTDRKRKTSSD